MRIEDLTIREKVLQTAVLRLEKNMRIGENVGGLFVGSAIVEHDDELGLIKTKKLIEKVQENAKISLLVCADFENGCGRMPGLTDLPYLMSLGATNDKQLAYDYGKATALEAKAVGVNWNFAPVVDLNLPENCYSGNSRIIGDNPDNAIGLLKQIIQGMHDNGMVACAKHFPGAYDDGRDSHVTPSSNELSRDMWKKLSGKVFQELIDDGVKTVMAAHISLPSYQTQITKDGLNLPATLSHELITKLLKEEMGFDGIVVTDALDMGGFLGWYDTPEQSEIECFKAGCDMLLWPSKNYVDNLVNAVETGEVSIKRLDDAVTRILKVKEEMGLFDKNINKDQLSKEELQFIEDVKKRTEEKSITLVRDKNNFFPISPEKTKKIAVVPITHYKTALEYAEFMVELLKKRGFEACLENKYMLESDFEKYDLVIHALFSKYGQPWGFSGFMKNEFLKLLPPNRHGIEKSAVVSFGDPYFGYRYFGRVYNYVNAYSMLPGSVEAFVKAATGEIEFTDFSPVRLRGMKIENNRNEK